MEKSRHLWIPGCRTAVSEPSDAMEKMEIVPSAEFGTYRKLPVGSIAGMNGPLAAPPPVGNVAVGESGAREPSDPTENPLMFHHHCGHINVLACGVLGNAQWGITSAKGEPVIGVRLPSKEEVLVAKAATLPGDPMFTM